MSKEALKAWGDDVALRGPDAPKNDGSIKHLIEYLLTVYERFGNTCVTTNLQWGATALHKLSEERERIAELEAQLAARPEVGRTVKRDDVIFLITHQRDALLEAAAKEKSHHAEVLVDMANWWQELSDAVMRLKNCSAPSPRGTTK